MATYASLIPWPDPVFELVGFVASFLAVGAVGFRYGVIARLDGVRARAASAADPAVLVRAARRAAALGLAGAIVSAALRVRHRSAR